MNQDKKNEIILETLDRINESLERDSNALISRVNEKGCAPEGAYCELVQSILELGK